MARGQPDYGAYRAASVGAGLSDMAELAARLGSINRYDQRGRVVDYDDFETPYLNWQDESISLSQVALYPTLGKSGLQCLKCLAGGSLNDYARVVRYYDLLPSGRIGIEVFWTACPAGTTLELQLARITATREIQGKLLLNFDTNVVSIFNPTAGYTVLPVTLNVTNAFPVWYLVKLVIDCTTEKYVKLILAGAEHDLSSYPLYYSAVGGANEMLVGLKVENIGGASPLVYLDDYILTQDEP